MKKYQVCSVPSIFEAVVVNGSVVQCTPMTAPVTHLPRQLPGDIIGPGNDKYQWGDVEIASLTVAAIDAFNNFDVYGAIRRFVQ